MCQIAVKKVDVYVVLGYVCARNNSKGFEKWNLFKVTLEASTPKRENTSKKETKKKQTEYKINLDFDVIYTKHILKNNLSFLSTK